MGLGLTVHRFDGVFGELLNVNPPDGTMGAISVRNNSGRSLHVLLMVNGTFLHSAPILTAAISTYFER